jgi:outer membrane protein assembly factor BamB
VYCLNAETGDEIWRYSFKYLTEFQSTPTIEGKYVYALDISGELLCFSAKNGKLRWKKDLITEYDVVRPFYGFAGSLNTDVKFPNITDVNFPV